MNLKSQNLYPNFAKKVANSVWATTPGTYIYYVVVVDDDVDIAEGSDTFSELDPVQRGHPVVYDEAVE